MAIDRWWAALSDEYDPRSWLDYRHILAGALAHATEAPLLDVGCGYGFLVECARRFGVSAIGLDGAAHALAICRERYPDADIRAWRGGAPLPIESESIGVAVLNQFVDHITLEENRILFAELHRALKPAGVVLVHSPSRFNDEDNDPGHVTAFSPSEFAAFVRSFAFDVLEQKFIPRNVLGRSRPARYAVRAIASLIRPERWAATIDLVARKRGR